MPRVRVRKKPDREALQLWYLCPLTGKQITKSAETDNPKEAERKAAAWELELAGQLRVENPSWDEFTTRIESEFLAKKPPNTRSAYLSAFSNWEKHVGKVRRLDLITPSIISKFAAKLGETRESTTVAKNLRHIRAALRWAESMEMIRRTPRIVMPKTNRRRLARARAVTRDEFNAMRAAVELVRPAEEVAVWQRLLDLLWLSGLRIAESLDLSWDSPPLRVDLDSGRYPRIVIFAEGHKSRDDETSVITPEFNSWLQQTPKLDRTGTIVKGLEKYSRPVASKIVIQFGEKAGIITAPEKYASAHDIRRAFGQRWAKIVRPLTLQRMMRHASIQTTLSFYVDLGDEDVGAELWGGFVPPTVPDSPS